MHRIASAAPKKEKTLRKTSSKMRGKGIARPGRCRLGPPQQWPRSPMLQTGSSMPVDASCIGISLPERIAAAIGMMRAYRVACLRPGPPRPTLLRSPSQLSAAIGRIENKRTQMTHFNMSHQQRLSCLHRVHAHALSGGKCQCLAKL